MSHSNSNDDQLIRRLFDAVYDFSFGRIIQSFTDMNKVTRWILISIISGIVLVFVLIQLASIGVEAYLWSQRPPLDERLQAPYGLNERGTPVVDPEMLSLYEIQQIDLETLETERAAYVEEIYSSALVEAQAAFDAAVASGEVITVEMAETLEAQTASAADTTEGDEEATDDEAEIAIEESSDPPVARVEDFLPDFDEAAARLAVIPEPDLDYFVVLKDVETFTRAHLFPDVQMHPALDCLTYIELEQAQTCGLEILPTFIEGADYVDPEGNQLRFVATHYETGDDATDSIRAMRRYSRRIGGLGNYSVADINTVKYFFGLSQGYYTLFWAEGEWLFAVSTQDQDILETFATTVTF